MGRSDFSHSANNETAKAHIDVLKREGWPHPLAAALSDSVVHAKHLRNSFATPSPACDEEHAYFVWSTPDEYTLLAMSHDGQEKWKLDLGPYTSMHSAGPSPIVYEDLLVLGNDQDGESSLLAFDRHTGELRWQTMRKAEAVSYATPCVLAREGLADELIFLSGAHGVSGIDPKTGKSNWELDVFDKRTCALPILAGGMIWGSCGSGGGGNYVASVQPGTPDATKPREVWKITDSAPYVPTMVGKGDLVFLWSDKGVVSCVKTSTGQVLWKQRVGGNFSGSPVCVGERLSASPRMAKWSSFRQPTNTNCWPAIRWAKIAAAHRCGRGRTDVLQPTRT